MTGAAGAVAVLAVRVRELEEEASRREIRMGELDAENQRLREGQSGEAELRNMLGDMLAVYESTSDYLQARLSRHILPPAYLKARRYIDQWISEIRAAGMEPLESKRETPSPVASPDLTPRQYEALRKLASSAQGRLVVAYDTSLCCDLRELQTEGLAAVTNTTEDHVTFALTAAGWDAAASTIGTPPPFAPTAAPASRLAMLRAWRDEAAAQADASRRQLDECRALVDAAEDRVAAAERRHAAVTTLIREFEKGGEP